MSNLLDLHLIQTMVMQLEGNDLYYLYSSGEMATGFINLANDSVYYLDPSQGNLVTGWKLVLF